MNLDVIRHLKSRNRSETKYQIPYLLVATSSLVLSGSKHEPDALSHIIIAISQLKDCLIARIQLQSLYLGHVLYLGRQTMRVAATGATIQKAF